MGKSLSSVKEALGGAIDILEGNRGGGLPEEELRDLVARIQLARGVLVQNEKKIWLRTKKGREMLGGLSVASTRLYVVVESGSDFDGIRVAVDRVERLAKDLNEEIRKRSMVVT